MDSQEKPSAKAGGCLGFVALVVAAFVSVGIMALLISLGLGMGFASILAGICFLLLRVFIVTYGPGWFGAQEQLPTVVTEFDEWIEKGSTLEKEGNTDQALAAFDKALALSPNHLVAWNKKGSLLSSLGRASEALAAFRIRDAIVERELDLALGWPSGALAVFGNAPSTGAFDGDDWNAKGVALQQQGRTLQAKAAFEKCIEINPANVFAWRNKGILLLNLGFVDEALLCFQRELSLDSGSSVGWHNKGVALQNLKRVDEAIDAYDHAVAADSKLTDSWRNRGQLLLRLGRAEEALASFDRVLAINSTGGDDWNNKGVALQSLGRTDQALAAYKKASKIDPSSDLARKNAEPLIKK